MADDDIRNLFKHTDSEALEKELGEPIAKKELTELDLYSRRLKTCVENWPEAISGGYDPRCCRFPKSCSPHARIEAVEAGNVTESDLEPEWRM